MSRKKIGGFATAKSVTGSRVMLAVRLMAGQQPSVSLTDVEGQNMNGEGKGFEKSQRE